MEHNRQLSKNPCHGCKGIHIQGDLEKYSKRLLFSIKLLREGINRIFENETMQCKIFSGYCDYINNDKNDLRFCNNCWL